MNKKILFLADNHYGTHGGRALYEELAAEFSIQICEDAYAPCLDAESLASFDVLMTCAIGGTPGAPHAPESCETAVRSFLETGKPLFLIHGGSATFWEWAWWREAVGLRWVRPGDPDGIEPSTHPVVPFELKKAKSRHPLLKHLQEVSVPTDELYIEMETTRPLLPLLESSFEGIRYPMAYLSTHQWGGQVAGFLPGHAPEVVRLPGLVNNVKAILRYLSENA